MNNLIEQFDFETELKYHPENFDTDVDLEDYEGADDMHEACEELAEIEAYEKSLLTIN